MSAALHVCGCATRGQFARFVQEAGHSTAGGCYVWTGSQWNNDASKDWRNPGFSQTENDPVACVNWNDAKTYADWLKRKTGRNYRLLTEAEWEYVARAGTTTAFSFGSTITPQQANYETKMSYAGSPFAASSRGQTAPPDQIAFWENVFRRVTSGSEFRNYAEKTSGAAISRARKNHASSWPNNITNRQT